MWAASSGSEGCVRLLLGAGADRDIQDNNGRTVLDIIYASTGAIHAILAYDTSSAS